MTATEAKALTLAAKTDMPEILLSINSMAKAGHDYSFHDIFKIKDPDAYKKELEGLGFSVKVTDKHFEINW